MICGHCVHCYIEDTDEFSGVFRKFNCGGSCDLINPAQGHVASYVAPWMERECSRFAPATLPKRIYPKRTKAMVKSWLRYTDPGAPSLMTEPSEPAVTKTPTTPQRTLDLFI